MGIVYEGFDPFIERTVAIKTIQKTMIDKSDADEILGRFRREAQAAGRLTHPNIVSVYEYGDDGDVAFIAMEYIVGIELKEHFDKTLRFKIIDCVKIMTQLLDALEYSHTRGVVHRDIKPSNILITQDGQVKIADFGIAKIESSELTQVGTVLGTPSYMSPEQFMGAAADRRSDIYSAGVILYQFLAGERPFTGSNMTMIMHKVMNQAPAPLLMLNPDMPEALQEVVMKAISKRPEDRYQSAAEFMKALKLAAESPMSATRTADPDATKISKPVHNPQNNEIDQSAIIDFNMDDFEVRLKEAKQEADRNSAALIFESQPDNSLREVIQEVHQYIQSSPVSDESGLSGGLAREAKDSRQLALQEAQIRGKRVDDGLNRIAKYFQLFIRQVNDAQPKVSRAYRFDEQTTYPSLKWKKAIIDSRKLSLSDMAFMDYVLLKINLCATVSALPKATETGALKAPSTFGRFKKGFDFLAKRVIGDAGATDKKPEPEPFKGHPAPDIFTQIKFQGNYTEYNINIQSRNMESYGDSAYKLEINDVTPELLDSLGIFLLGRSDKLPTQLHRVS